MVAPSTLLALIRGSVPTFRQALGAQAPEPVSSRLLLPSSAAHLCDTCRSRQDRLAFAVHAWHLAVGYKLLAVGQAASQAAGETSPLTAQPAVRTSKLTCCPLQTCPKTPQRWALTAGTARRTPSPSSTPTTLVPPHTAARWPVSHKCWTDAQLGVAESQPGVRLKCRKQGSKLLVTASGGPAPPRLLELDLDAFVDTESGLSLRHMAWLGTCCPGV